MYVGAEVSIGTFLTNYISDTLSIDIKEANNYAIELEKLNKQNIELEKQVGANEQNIKELNENIEKLNQNPLEPDVK